MRRPPSGTSRPTNRCRRWHRETATSTGPKLYCTPIPLDAHRFLVSARGPTLVRDLAGTCQSIALPKPDNGTAVVLRPAGPGASAPASQIGELRDRGGGRPVMAGLPARGIHAPGPQTPPRLMLQDIYNGLEPQVKRGEVKGLRVVREMPKTVRIHPDRRAFGFQFPVISAGATYAGKDVLGEVEVAADGSACFEVPAGVPIYFIALDAKGRGVQRMRSFTHLMPGEIQGCVGCHESRQHTASLRTLPLAMKQPPQKLAAARVGPRRF